MVHGVAWGAWPWRRAVWVGLDVCRCNLCGREVMGVMQRCNLSLRRGRWTDEWRSRQGRGSDGIVKRLPGDGRQGGVARRSMRGGVWRTDAGFYRVRSWGEWRIRSVSLPFDGACRGRAWRWDCRVAPVWCDWRKRGRMFRASARGYVHAKASPMACDMPRNVQFRRVAGSLHGESKELARFVLVTARIVSCGGFQSPFLSIDGE